MDKFPSSFTSCIPIIPDTREQLPYTDAEVAPLVMAEPQTLDYGDYTFPGGMHTTRVERKSLPDLLQSITHGRKRFEKEIRGLLGFPHRLLLVESSWPEIYAGNWRNKVGVKSVIGTLVKYQVMGLPVTLAGDRKHAARFCAKFLYMAARDSYRNSRDLLACAIEETATT